MDKLLNISKTTNIVIHALMYMASKENEKVSVKQMALDLKVSQTYLAKVLRPFIKHGIINSTRGLSGGFVLNKKPKEISILEVLLLAEGDFPKNYCLFGKPVCKKGFCVFTELNDSIEALIVEKFKDITLEDLKDRF